MAMRYVEIEPLIPESVLKRLQDCWPKGKNFTVKRDGPLSVGEQELPADLVADLRQSIELNNRPSLIVRLASVNAKANSEKRNVAERLAKAGHPPHAVAIAADVSESTARNMGATERTADLVDSAETLIVGLAAVRQYHGIPQSLLAEDLGLSQVRLSQAERRQTMPEPGDVKRYVDALAVRLRMSPNRLRRRALETGAAILDTGVPDGTAHQLQGEDGGPAGPAAGDDTPST